MLQASHDLLCAGNVALNCMETMLRNNVIVIFMHLLLCKIQQES